MRTFAKVVNGVVVNIMVAEPEFFATFVDTSPGDWVETSTDGSLRKNYAMIGGTYDRQRDAFIAIKEDPSWVLNEETCQWELPPT
jgi:hypothetical protein